MHKTPKRILTGLGIIMGVLGVVYAVALAHGRAELRRAYAALEENGRPMRRTEVIPPTIPEAENAAILYESAASALKAEPLGETHLLEHLGGLSSSFIKGSLGPDGVVELKELIGRQVVASALATVEQGTARRACRFERDYRAGPLPNLPILGDLKNLGLVLAAQARLEAEAGASQRAWNTIVIWLRLADALRSDPTSESQLVRLNMISHSCGIIQELCEISPPGGENYRLVEDLLRKAGDITPLVNALDAERLLTGEWLFSLGDDELYETLRGNSLIRKDYAPANIGRLEFRLAVFQPSFVADHATYLQLMNECVRFLQGPYVPSGAAAHNEIRNREVRYLLTNRLAPLIRYIQSVYCDTATAGHVTRAGLALLRYKQVRGRFPETLNALGLEGLVDPFTQEPLHYRIEGEGFVVYSVGEDLKDNGGSPPQHRQRTDYDLVWRFPSPPDHAAGSSEQE